MKKIFMSFRPSFRMTLCVIFAFVFLIFNFSTARAQSTRYPIPELGNCRNAQECYLYCQIPQNTPACWSYGKYVLNNGQEVLGESSVNVTYPIAELGNCSDANACFIYCSQPKNQPLCYSYAKNHGLIKEEENENEDDLPPDKMQEIIASAKTELGCETKEQCMSICAREENHAKCEAFAKKHNLYKGPPPIDEQGGVPPADILEKAKTELGCTSEISCKELCNKPENAEKCMDFAKNNKLMREDEYEIHKKEFDNYKEQKEKMLEEAKQELGCDSYESCAKFCGDPQNVEKCMTLGRRHGMGPPPSQKYPPPKPCTNEAECRAYCEKNPQECKGFNEIRSSSYREINEQLSPISPITRNANGQDNKPGEFLGPGGCKTESECKAYCEKHESECPGFSKFQPQSGKSPDTIQGYKISPPPNSDTQQRYQPNQQSNYPQPTYVRPTEFRPTEFKPTEFHPSEPPEPNLLQEH